MDARYRELERLASLGDREAISALRQARLRRGEGINFGLWAPLIDLDMEGYGWFDSRVTSHKGTFGVQNLGWLHRHFSQVRRLVFVRGGLRKNLFLALLSEGALLRVYRSGFASERVFNEYISARRSLHGIPLTFIAPDGLILYSGQVSRDWPVGNGH